MRSGVRHFIAFCLALLFAFCGPKNADLKRRITISDSTLFMVAHHTSVGYDRRTAKIFPYYFYRFYRNGRFAKMIKQNGLLRPIPEGEADDVIESERWKVEGDSIFHINRQSYKIATMKDSTIVLFSMKRNDDTLVLVQVSE